MRCTGKSGLVYLSNMKIRRIQLVTFLNEYANKPLRLLAMFRCYVVKFCSTILREFLKGCLCFHWESVYVLFQHKHNSITYVARLVLTLYTEMSLENYIFRVIFIF